MTEIQETLADYELAVLAKSKGFDCLTSRYYKVDGKLVVNFADSGCNESEYYFDADSFNENWNDGRVMDKYNASCWGCKSFAYTTVYSAPTLSLLQTWLREKHGIITEVKWHKKTNSFMCYIPWNKSSRKQKHYLCFDVFDDALKYILKYVLTNFDTYVETKTT